MTHCHRQSGASSDDAMQYDPQTDAFMMSRRYRRTTVSRASVDVCVGSDEQKQDDGSTGGAQSDAPKDLDYYNNSMVENDLRLSREVSSRRGQRKRTRGNSAAYNTSKTKAKAKARLVHQSCVTGLTKTGIVYNIVIHLPSDATSPAQVFGSQPATMNSYWGQRAGH